MKKENLEKELKREVNSMLPENMVAEIKQQEVRKERVNKNISVIQEKQRHSIIPMIASCVASVIICLAVFLPMALQNKEDYNKWLADRNQTQIEQELEDLEEDKNTE